MRLEITYERLNYIAQWSKLSSLDRVEVPSRNNDNLVSWNYSLFILRSLAWSDEVKQYIKFNTKSPQFSVSLPIECQTSSQIISSTFSVRITCHLLLIPAPSPEEDVCLCVGWWYWRVCGDSGRGWVSKQSLNWQSGVWLGDVTHRKWKGGNGWVSYLIQLITTNWRNY